MTTERGRSGPTITEVAQAAKVSRQTVSNALNFPDRVRPDTLARVLEVIEELGYVPNRVARSLRTHATRQIGYRLGPECADGVSFLQDSFLHALTRAAEEEGYLLLVFGSGRSADELTRYADMLRTGSVDGFVLSGIDPGDQRPAWLAQRHAPFVCFGRPRPATPDYLWVDVDSAAGVEAAVDHLVAAGHRDIGFLGWSSASGPGHQRLSGWGRAMRKHGLGTEHRRYARDTLTDSTTAALDLLRQSPSLTAVVAASDTFALGCYAAARLEGREIGRDLAVIGFDDSPTASMVTPALTSIRQPLDEIGRTIMRLLVARLRGQTPRPAGVLLPPSLVVRESA
ncbi:LacI family DNA-binding transcriptional regulator [Streptomyces sp. NK08204]|uniref:LacI family DNA-binding transcriptional regulator n=1 Tax=Streptomyces sp. NK08204 TaxID=2873260 RepID=UPI001CED4FE6|nr:LacI family DNA-binding transcriptional regulator [Streptomyces sp. NK08204]